MEASLKLKLKIRLKYLCGQFLILCFGYLWFFMFLPYKGDDYSAIDYILLALLIVVFLANLHYLNEIKKIDFNKICSWCNSIDLEFLQGKTGLRHWKYTNKDGSKNRVRKNNYEWSYYNSCFKCTNCGAETLFSEIRSEHPSYVPKVTKRKLSAHVQGEGERIGTDWSD